MFIWLWDSVQTVLFMLGMTLSFLVVRLFTFMTKTRGIWGYLCGLEVQSGLFYLCLLFQFSTCSWAPLIHILFLYMEVVLWQLSGYHQPSLGQLIPFLWYFPTFLFGKCFWVSSKSNRSVSFNSSFDDVLLFCKTDS